MEAKKLLTKSANELFLQGELTQEFIEKNLPFDLFQKLLTTVYSELNIVLPDNISGNICQILLLVSVLFNTEFELVETDVPNVYRLILKEPEQDVYALDEVTDVEKHLMVKLSLFLKIYHDALENQGLEQFEDFLQSKIHSWNANKMVAQERVYSISRKMALPEIEKETGFPEETIRKILDDYQARIDFKKLTNVKRFEQKLLSMTVNANGMSRGIGECVQFILDEIANGGTNIQQLEDLFPKQLPIYQGVSLS